MRTLALLAAALLPPAASDAAMLRGARRRAAPAGTIRAAAPAGTEAFVLKRAGLLSRPPGRDLARELLEDVEGAARTFGRAQRDVRQAAYKRAAPSVVTVAVERPAPFGGGEVFAGRGAGVAWDGEHVVTNRHVVKEGSVYSVVLPDGKSVPAVLVGTDPTRDLAVLAVRDGARLRPVPRASSRRLRPGADAFAIGSPHGLHGTLTAGSISAVDRVLRVDEHAIAGILQHDAALSGGSSGGALLDHAGRLIGVNVAIMPGADGIAFAVPTDAAERSVAAILARGRPEAPHHVRPAVLGAAVEEAGGRLEVREPGGAGLRAGDVLVSLDGQTVADALELALALNRRLPGDAVRVRVRRDGRDRTLTVTLAAEGG